MDIRLAGLTKRFDRVVAVEAADLHVPAGALMTLLGPSGCGKTTTLRMIAGLERPTAGRITIGEEIVFDAATGRDLPAEDRAIGMVFQSYAIWPHLSVFENVAFPLRVRRLAHAAIEERVHAALRVVRLEALADRYPSALSGGQQQRVALARAVVFEPRLLLLDEPLSNLDAALREELRLEIRTVQQRLGITTILVTHDQAEALALSDQLAVMNHGRIVQVGMPRAIYAEPASPFVAGFVGWKNALAGTVSGVGSVRVGESSIIDGLHEVPATPGQPIVLACRPEDVEIVTAPGALSDFRGEIRAALYMGTHTVLEVAIGQATLIAHASATAGLPQGAQVGVRLRRDRVRVFPAP